MSDELQAIDFAIVGGSGTLSRDFPKNFADVEIFADDLFFDTPYGQSPAFRLCSVGGKNFRLLFAFNASFGYDDAARLSIFRNVKHHVEHHVFDYAFE